MGGGDSVAGGVLVVPREVGANASVSGAVGSAMLTGGRREAGSTVTWLAGKVDPGAHADIRTMRAPKTIRGPLATDIERISTEKGARPLFARHITTVAFGLCLRIPNTAPRSS